MDSVHSLARSGRTATTKRSSFAHVESLPPRLSAAAGPTFRWRRWGSVITSLPDALSESGTAEMLDTFGSARSTETDGEGAPLIMPLAVSLLHHAFLASLSMLSSVTFRKFNSNCSSSELVQTSLTR